VEAFCLTPVIACFFFVAGVLRGPHSAIVGFPQPTEAFLLLTSWFVDAGCVAGFACATIV
jgi:hypothetical protein